jgi:5-bromo-4-chloroindolyl phosphate hydrolysis protein
MIVQVMSAIRKDFIATHLRSQLNSLRNILDNIEEENKVDCDYARESLKDIEVKLRQLRKLCVN